tara:strand:- start:1397 stop:1645 length:249 start_codon:yes stop_codon:yes gene_type:complete
MFDMTNKQRRKKMSKVKVKKETNDASFLSILGWLLIVFAIIDFGMSWTGVNLTGFLGPVSRFTPMIFGFIGASLLNAGKESG